MTHLRSLISKEDTSSSEYKIDDIDNPNGWDWKELDWLFGMGFAPEGETRLQYNHVKDRHQGRSKYGAKRPVPGTVKTKTTKK